MKKIMIALMALLSASVMFAQAPQSETRISNGQKIESEKIGYITRKMNLTPEEAQRFWPVYNIIAEEQKAQNKAVGSARRELQKAVYPKKDSEAKPASPAEVEKLLKNYRDAMARQENVLAKHYGELVKAVSVEKVAKYYLAEESFRRQQINKMKAHQQGPKGFGAGQGPQGAQGPKAE